MSEERFEDAVSPPTGETELNLTEESNERSSVIHTTDEQNGLLILEAPLPRPIKHRPTFTEDQVATMETIFEQRQYLSPMERESVASSVGLSPQQVRVWFQNRRQKVKQFLNQKQMRNGQQPLVNGRTRQETGDNSSSGGGSASTIGSLTPQQLTNNIDPILQLLLPKMIDNGEESRDVAKNDDCASTSNEKDTETLITALEQVTKEGAEKGVESVTPNTSATPAITLTPAQTLLCLTPYLLPLQLQSSSVQLPAAGKGVGNPTNTISIPANAIQLLQGLSNSSSQLQTIPLQLAKVIKQNKTQPQIIGSPSVVPLKAQSPTRIDFNEEASEIKSEESTSQHVVDSKSEQVTNDVANPVLTGVSSEILQQLLGGISGDGLKTTWNVTPSTSVVTSHTTNTSASVDSPRKKRQVFSGVQTTELEKQFEISPYIDAKERDKLAEKIGLHPDQVKVWFQNRRTKQNRVSWRQQKEPTEHQ